MKISDAIARNQSRIQAGGLSGAIDSPQPPESTLPPGSAPLDLPIALPNRGAFMPGILPVNQSAFGDQARAASSGRSSVFLPTVPSTPVTASTKPAITTTVWNPRTLYNRGDVVVSNGSVYVATAPSQNTVPPLPSQPVAIGIWQLVGSSSADGIGQGLSQSAIALAAVDSSGNVDLSADGVLPTGSISPIGSSALSYVSTTSTITISWEQLSIYTVDGNVVEVPAGSQEITGLAAGVTYSFFPYFYQGVLSFVEESQVLNLVTLAGMQTTGSGYVTDTQVAETTNNGSSRISVEFWVFPTSGSGTLVQLDANQTGAGGSASGPMVALGMSGGSSYQLSANGSSSSSGTIFGPVLASNQWSHVVVTFSMGSGAGGDTQVTMYLNGVQTAAQLQSISSVTSYYWKIGTGNVSGVGNGSGIISRVAIYTTHILTQAEVTAHYSTMLQVGAAAYDAAIETSGEATYYWILGETSGTTAADSIDSNPGTYSGPYTLDVAEAIGGTFGTPPIAWINPAINVTMAQFSQQYQPLSGGPLQVSTPSSGSGGGAFGGFPIPHIPAALANEI